MEYENLTLAHNIGEVNHSNYHTREQIKSCNHPIGFDGIYQSVYDNMDCLEGKKGILFVMGNYVGGDNRFDLPYVPQFEKYCTWEQIRELSDKFGFSIGWHTWNHPNLTKITRHEMYKEITPPFPMDYFAYPYGEYNQVVIDVVKDAGFKRAYSVTQGSTNPNEKDYQYKIYRDYII